jgi:CheY-like chemotaxis protein/signal transduction histidine kinase
MWQLSSYSHSLLHLYRFRDRHMEERYQADLNKWSVYNVQLGYFSATIIQMLACAFYTGVTPLPLGFWVCLAHGMAACGLFLHGLCNHRSQRHTVVINFVFTVLTTSSVVTLLFVEPPVWTVMTYASWVPEGHHMYIGADASQLTVIDSRFRDYLLQSYVQAYWLIRFSNIQISMMHLCLTGLNVWSLVGYAFVFTSCTAELWYSSQYFAQTLFDFLYLATLILSFIVLAGLLERIQRQKFLAETLLEQQMRASETADSILNHTLKNILADVAAYLELFLAEDAPRGVLEDALACLRRGVKACKERQVYLKLVVGSYTPVAHAVDLEAFAQDLVAGRAVQTSGFTGTAHFDRTLLTLILDNALSNAVKHGCPDNPDVTLTVRALSPSPSEAGPNPIEFVISNAADRTRPPLTSDAVCALLAGGPRPQQLGRASLLSDGIGLGHAKLAADVGGIRISLAQEGPRVVFRAVVEFSESAFPAPGPCHVPGPPGRYVLTSSASLVLSNSFDVLPPHTRIFVCDDSASSRRILEHQLRNGFPGVCVTVFGAKESDIDLFTAMAVEDAAIVILDQHLEYPGASYLGTTVAQRLRLLGYTGMICIRSADDSPEDQVLYAASGAHVFLGKDLPGHEMVRRLADAYRDFTVSLPERAFR